VADGSSETTRGILLSSGSWRVCAAVIIEHHLKALSSLISQLGLRLSFISDSTLYFTPMFVKDS